MRRFLWVAVGFLLAFDVSHAVARADPTCSLSVVTEPGINQGDIADHLTGLKRVSGPSQFYLATLNGPAGQQLSYLKPTEGVWTTLFLNQGPGTYTAGLLTVVDNNKGSAKEEPLATSCSIVV